MARWRIYYADGSTFADEDGPAEDAPALGVQAINQMVGTPEGRQMLHGAGQRPNRTPVDYFVLDEGDEWLGVDLFGLWDYLQRPGWRKVLFGRTISNPEFAEILYRAGHDPDFYGR